MIQFMIGMHFQLENLYRYQKLKINKLSKDYQKKLRTKIQQLNSNDDLDLVD